VELKVTCEKCRFFVEAVQDIRGPYWQGRERAGLRRSYRTGAARDGAVVVSGPYFDPRRQKMTTFFDLLRDETCRPLLDHLAEVVQPVRADLRGARVREHTRELPVWIKRVLNSVDFFSRPGDDAAARVAAAVLGISVRSIYRELPRKVKPAKA
jgi:hypothetical protein